MNTKGDISIVLNKQAVLQGLPSFLNERSDKAKESYIILRDFLQGQNMSEMMSDFYELSDVPMAILDLDANVLASSKWQRICLAFHRANPDTEARCLESDTKLANALEQGEDYTMYRCKNGLVDCATPIVIEGEHIANLFIGQFLLDTADRWFFTGQASAYGFDQDEYLSALDEVPVLSEKTAMAMLNFFRKFSQLVTTMVLNSCKKA